MKKILLMLQNLKSLTGRSVEAILDHPTQSMIVMTVIYISVGFYFMELNTTVVMLAAVYISFVALIISRFIKRSYMPANQKAQQKVPRDKIRITYPLYRKGLKASNKILARNWAYMFISIVGITATLSLIYYQGVPMVMFLIYCLILPLYFWLIVPLLAPLFMFRFGSGKKYELFMKEVEKLDLKDQ